jgi:hypothetical protein
MTLAEANQHGGGTFRNAMATLRPMFESITRTAFSSGNTRAL